MNLELIIAIVVVFMLTMIIGFVMITERLNKRDRDQQNIEDILRKLELKKNLLRTIYRNLVLSRLKKFALY